MGTLVKPFGYLLRILAELFNHNYGWAIIGFTIIVNAIMTPLVIKQQKSTLQMQRLTPQMQALRKKYEFDKEKLNQETMKLYQDNNINPMSGCLPLLIQLPVIFILYRAIMQPLTYMFNLTPEVILQLKELMGVAPDAIVQEMQLLQQLLSQHANLLSMPEFSHILTLNFSFFGIDLGAKPQLAELSPLWLIPIFAALTSFLLSKLTMAQSGQPQPDPDNPAAASMGSMNKVMPLMSAFFTFSFPAGIGLYWIAGNVVRMAQQYLVTEYIKKRHPDNPLVIDVEAQQKAPSQKKKKKGRN